ncbi:TauD/TfdA family dioxygenase [Bordetella hinzii]|uniref:TauD/TfdA family dioxygenase n=1 Tax=Bordetella hinzii TaxID=103855 RepID=UPI00138F7538
MKKLEDACNASAKLVVVQPGDVLIVSNRLALHGRGEVGDGVGGQSRWLLRAYGLDTSNLQQYKRYSPGPLSHMLFP